MWRHSFNTNGSGKKIELALIFICCTFFNWAYAQKSAYQFPANFPEDYDFHVQEAFTKLNTKPLYGLNAKQSTNFRINTIYGLQQSIDQNEIYLDWPLVENYLRQVLDSVVPIYYRDKYHFQTFVARDPSVNAYANDNGFLFFNIGLFASLRNEAALAATIGHETGHSVYDHGYNQYVDYVVYSSARPSGTFNPSLVSNFYSRNYEMIADTFAFHKIVTAGYNLNAVKGKFDIYERNLNRNIHTMFSVYNGNNEERARNYFKVSSSHPMNKERIESAMAIQKKTAKPGVNYLVDSVLFNKIRVLAQEECKKIRFEKADYRECLKLCFIDYLYNEKKLKNSYYLIESLRRLLYIHPELINKSFLTDEYSDKEFVENNYSILKKPELLFLDSIQQSELINHPLFKDEIKPFKTYGEALVYFCNQAKNLGLNEANFSLALFYYAQKKEELFTSSLETYIAANGGINTDFATMLLQNKKPVLQGSKMLFVYDNSGMYAEDKFWGGMNYYQAISKRSLNKEVTPLLAADTGKIHLVFMNELMGNKPKELYEYQKIEQTLIALFTDEEKEIYRKKRVSSREDVEHMALTDKYNKNIFMLAPEFYKWFKENDFGSFCFSNISYDFEEALSTKETRNDYTTYYFNFSVMRPYFKMGTRNSANKKETDTEMAKEIADFLFAKE